MDRLLSRLVLGTFLVLIPIPAAAQMHAHGSAWIHRDAPMGTMVHAYGDTLCAVEFPASCYGGMMSPDSLSCTWWAMPADSLPAPMPRYCGAAVHCEIRDDDDRMMMPGHMTQPGVFRSPLLVTIHYDPAVMTARGMNLATLVLTTWNEGQATVVSSASHDRAASLFTVSTTQLSEWYGISDSTDLPPMGVEAGTWGQIKATYR
jgi:hypothetical protein